MASSSNQCQWVFYEVLPTPLPFSGPLSGAFKMITTVSLSVGDPLDGRDYAANPPTCGPLAILPPALKRWGPLDGRGYVANPPTCGRFSLNFNQSTASFQML